MTIGTGRMGADDEVGAPNRTTPELVLKALGLVKKSKVATLAFTMAASCMTKASGPRDWAPRAGARGRGRVRLPRGSARRRRLARLTTLRAEGNQCQRSGDRDRPKTWRRGQTARHCPQSVR